MNTLKQSFFKRVLSALLATIMVFSLGVIGLTSVGAAETELAETGANTIAGGHIYFDNSITKWNDACIQFVIGHDGFSRTYTMSKITNTNLYYVNLSDYEYHDWSDATYYAVIGTGDKWGDGNWGSGNISNATHRTAAYTTTYNLDADNKCFLVTPASSSNGCSISIDYQGTSDDYDCLNTQNTVWAAYAGYEGTVYEQGATGGTVTVSGYKFSSSSKNSVSSYSSSNLSGHYVYFAPSTTATYTAIPASGFEFVGWSHSRTTPTIVNSNATMTLNISDAATVYYALFKEATAPLSVDANAVEDEVFAGTDIEIIAQANQNGATFTLKDSAGNTVGSPNTSGEFVIDTTSFAEGTYTYTVEASATINGQNVTATSDPITVKVNLFENLIITPVSIPSSVECGTPINLVVKANTSVEVTYVLKDGEGNIIAENTTGEFSQATTVNDKDTTKVFSIEASAVVNGTTYSATPITVNVDVTPISNTTEINIYFKSTSTKGFKPVASVTGMYQSFERVPMEKAFYICSNETGTADYWWYKSTVKVSDALPTVSFTVVSGRYDMEDTITFTVVDDVTDYYFAIDNLYYDIETGDHPNNLINVTDWEPVERNYCVNAVHMVYDENYDTEEELQYFATKCVMGLNGDVNGDDALNVKDATQVQKSLANLAELGSVGDKVSDFDDDGAATIKDATAIQKAVAGL